MVFFPSVMSSSLIQVVFKVSCFLELPVKHRQEKIGNFLYSQNLWENRKLSKENPPKHSSDIRRKGNLVFLSFLK